jgi:ubiquitin
MAVVVLLSGLAAGSASAAPAQSQPAGDDRLDVYIAKLDLRQLEQVRASGVDPH